MAEIINICPQAAEISICSIAHQVKRIENMSIIDLNRVQLVDNKGCDILPWDALIMMANHLLAIATHMMDFERACQQKRNEA